MNLTVAAQNIVLLNALRRVVQALQEAGVTPLILQGAALAETVYGNIAERAFADIDLLIHEEEIEKLSACLKALGYARAAKEDLMFCRHGRFTVRVDIHYGIWYLPAWAFQRLWQDSQPLAIAGGNARMMGADELLIYTSAHAAIHHGTLSPTALEDIHRICLFYREQLEWRHIIRKIKAYNLRIPLYHIFSAAKAAKSALIPREVLNELKPSSSAGLMTGALYRFIWRLAPTAQIGHLLKLISQRGLRSKIKFAFGALFPPRAFIARRYNVSKPLLILGFQLVRPGLQAIELVKAMMRLTGNIIARQLRLGNGPPGPGRAGHSAHSGGASPGVCPVQ